MLRTTLVTLAIAGTAWAQDMGRGNVGANGLEPRLSVQSASPGNAMRFRASGLNPPGRSGAQLLLLVAGAPAAVPLDAIGVRGAVLGVDLATLLVVGPVPVDAQGNADYGIRVDGAWSGVHLFVQAVHVDPRVTPPYVFSDSRAMTVGSPDPELVLAAGGTTAATLDVVRHLPDGRPGVPAPFLQDIVLRDLDLASLDESRTFRDDLPRPAGAGGVHAVRLPDGSLVARWDRPATNEGGLLRVHRSGRIERIHIGSAGAVAPSVAASASHVAFVTTAPPRLMLYRNDETNWPRTAEPVRDVTPAAGLRLEPDALAFGSKVLAYLDRNRGCFLIPLDGSAAIIPKLPNSGGRPPSVFDEEVGVSGDGRSFVFGAGSDRKIKDVYVVRDDGTAVNVTKKPTDYAEVGYSNPGRRIDMGLNHDGSLVSYIDDGGQEPENYVSKVALPQPVHITSSVAFVDSIDIGTTSRFPAKGGGLIIAGLDAQRLDLFFTPSISDRDVVALTKTAPSLNPPFGRDAKLTLLDLGSVRGADQYVLHAKHLQRAAAELWVVDTATKSARVASHAFGGRGVAVGPTSLLLAEDGAGLVVIDPTDTTAGFARPVPLGAGSVRALAFDGATGVAAAVSGSAGALDLWLIDPASARSLRVTPAGSDLGDLEAGSVPGSFHVLSAPGASGRTLLRWRAADGLRSVGGQSLRFFLDAD